jgi:hypothetical protein
MDDLNKLLAERGDYEIDKIRVNRRPISENSYINTIFKTIAGNPTNDATFNHTWLELSLKDKNSDKREVVAISKALNIDVKRNLTGEIKDLTEKSKSYVESKNINIDGKNITLNEFIDNAKMQHLRTGKQFEKYSLRCYNCQIFSLLSLKGSGFADDDVVKFINQDAEKVVPSWLQKLTDFITLDVLKK